MKVYRFAVYPAEGRYHFLECINDPALFTQAASMNEAVFMARDVASAMYGLDLKDILIELVIPPDVKVPFKPRRARRPARRPAPARSGV